VGGKVGEPREAGRLQETARKQETPKGDTTKGEAIGAAPLVIT